MESRLIWPQKIVSLTMPTCGEWSWYRWSYTKSMTFTDGQKPGIMAISEVVWINLHSKKPQPAQMKRVESHLDTLVNISTGVHASEDIQNSLLVAVEVFTNVKIFSQEFSQNMPLNDSMLLCQEQTLDIPIDVCAFKPW